LQVTASLFSHHKEVRVASGFGCNKARGEGERGRNKEEKTKTSLPLLHVQGKKNEKQCCLKTTLFCFSFPFFFGKTHETVAMSRSHKLIALASNTTHKIV
jgi:hypothetical protein